MDNALKKFIENSPVVKAAITEAIHRFYYDRVLSDKEKDIKALEENDAGNVLSTAWNNLPNWRHILKTTADKYYAENTSSVSIFGKPKKDIKIDFSIFIS